MSSGNGAKIALAKIGSLYHDVNSVNLWFGFTEESLEHKLEELEEGAITGQRDQPNSYKGVDHGDGDLGFEPNPNALGHILGAWYGTIASSVVTVVASNGANSGENAGFGQHFHRFTGSNSAFSNHTYLPPYNVAVYRDVGSAFIFKGTIFPTVKLMIKAGQLVKASATIMSRQVDLMDPTSMMGLVTSGGRPWLWDMASIEYNATGVTTAGLAANGSFEELNFTFELPHDGVSLLDGTKKYAEFVPSDFRRVKMDGTMSFRDLDAYLAFRNYEQHRLRVTMLNVNSNLYLGNPASVDMTSFLGYPGLRINIPGLKFTSWSAAVKGANRITAAFNAKAERVTGETWSSAVDLLNVVPPAEYTTGL